jgi:hypothetical protein
VPVFEADRARDQQAGIGAEAAVADVEQRERGGQIGVEVLEHEGGARGGETPDRHPPQRRRGIDAAPALPGPGGDVGHAQRAEGREHAQRQDHGPEVDCIHTAPVFMRTRP